VGLEDFFTKFVVRTTKKVENHWASTAFTLIAVQCLQYYHRRRNRHPPHKYQLDTLKEDLTAEFQLKYVTCLLYNNSKPLAATQIHRTMLLKNILDFDRITTLPGIIRSHVYYICPADIFFLQEMFGFLIFVTYIFSDEHIF